MNRYMIGIALALALIFVASEEVAGQSGARIDIRGGRIGASVAIGGLSVRISPPHAPIRGWVAANWGPVRLWVSTARPVRMRETLTRQDLRYLLGRETLRRIEAHGRAIGIRGQTWGRWFQVDRRTSMLQVTMGGVPVAELYDYRNDGFIDEILLTQPSRVVRFKERGVIRPGRRPGQW